MQLIKLVFIILLLMVGVAFSLTNHAPVSLDFYITKVTLPLSIVILLAIGSGLLLGSVLSLSFFLRIKRENRRLKRQHDAIQKEVANLRTLPMKS